jgi:hypothetical protein
MTSKLQTSNPGTSGEQVQTSVSVSVQQDSGSSGARRPLVQLPMDNNPIYSDTEENCQAEDVVSLAPGRSERQDIGLYSDDDLELSGSGRSISENNPSNTRFSKYLKVNKENTDKDTTTSTSTNDTT